MNLGMFSHIDLLFLMINIRVMLTGAPGALVKETKKGKF